MGWQLLVWSYLGNKIRRACTVSFNPSIIFGSRHYCPSLHGKKLRLRGAKQLACGQGQYMAELEFNLACTEQVFSNSVWCCLQEKGTEKNKTFKGQFGSEVFFSPIILMSELLSFPYGNLIPVHNSPGNCFTETMLSMYVPLMPQVFQICTVCQGLLSALPDHTYMAKESSKQWAGASSDRLCEGSTQNQFVPGISSLPWSPFEITSSL